MYSFTGCLSVAMSVLTKLLIGVEFDRRGSDNSRRITRTSAIASNYDE